MLVNIKPRVLNNDEKLFSRPKKINLDGPDCFQKYYHAKNFPEENYSTRHRGVGSLMIWEAFSSGKLKQEFISGRQKAADHLKTLNDLSQAQEWRRLCEEEWIFQQDNAAIHNASIKKKYLLEQKIRLLDYPACSPDLSPLENLWGLIVAKVYVGGQQYSAISEPRNPIIDLWKKHFRFNFRN